MQLKRRVVITGLGAVTPVGTDVAASWDAVVNGKSGIGPITEFDCSQLTTQIAGEVRNFNVEDYISTKEAKRCDRFIHYGMAAGIQAMRDSGLIDANGEGGATRASGGVDPERVGFSIGAGIGGIATIEETRLIYEEKGARRVSPFYIPGTIVNMVGGNLSIKYGFKGPNLSIVTACTTSTHNIGNSARLIMYGDADVMVSGGAEYATTPTALAGFVSAKATSTRNNDPEGASRPWDAERDGFVLSNGAAMLVVEEYEHAKRRGAPIYAELIGYGMSADAHHMTAPPEDGEGAARCMRVAIEDAGIAAEEVDYINAHGTSTPLGDRAESHAIKTVFGEHAWKLAVSSTKSMTGHLLGAAGSIEALFTILSIRDGIAPPTINLENPGEGCDLDYVPNSARKMPIRTAMSNSFGFGGTNGTLIFRVLED